MLVDDDETDDAADAEGCEPDVRIEHLNVRDNHAASSATDSDNGVLQIVGVHCEKQSNYHPMFRITSST